MKKASYLLYLIPFLTGLVLSIAGILGIDANLDPSASGEVPDAVKTAGLLTFTGLVSLVIGISFSLIYLYRAWEIIPGYQRRTTPGKAIGFLFIPFFNLYWIFPAVLGWAQDWNRSTAQRKDTPRANEKLFKVGVICLVTGIIPVIGSLTFIVGVVCHTLMVKKLCEVVNSARENRGN